MWYGTLARDEIVLGAMQLAPAPEIEEIEIFVEASQPESEVDRPLDLDQSIFRDRKHEADARSYRCRGK